MAFKTIVLSHLLTPALLGLAATASAEIYRCESDGVVEFSDTPCQAEPRPYRATGNVSVISAPDDLEQTTRLNQAFIEESRERREERQRERRNDAATAPIQREPAFAPAPRIYLPRYDRDIPRRQRYPVHPRAAHGADQRSDSAPERQPFSALGGPFPGTRRRDRDP